MRRDGFEDADVRWGRSRLPWIVAALLVCVVAYAGWRLRGAPGSGFWGEAKPRKFETAVMGTTAHLTIVPGRGMQVSVEVAARKAFAAMREVDRLMSCYKPESDIARLNAAPAGRTMAVDPLTWRVVMESLRLHRLTDGAFDITIGPLKALYRYHHGGEGEREATEGMPPRARIEAALARVGADKLIYRREGMRLGCKVAGMAVDLGGIAKGFGVDHAMRALQRLGVKNAMVEIGGELRLMGRVPLPEPRGVQRIGPAAGKAPGGGKGKAAAGGENERSPATRLWRTGIPDPRAPWRFISTLKLTDCAMATSGDYQQFFIHQGKRYSHIIDPQTGLPVQGGVVSVTVVHASSCMQADGLATSFSVMGPERTRKFLADYGRDLGIRFAILCVLQDDGAVRKVRIDCRGGADAADPGSEAGAE